MTHRVRAVVGDRVLDWIVGPDGVVFDVPDLVTQAAEPAKPVQIHPGMASEWEATHHSQNDEPQPRLHTYTNPKRSPRRIRSSRYQRASGCVNIAGCSLSQRKSR